MKSRLANRGPGGVLKSSFAQLWVRVGHLNDLTSQMLLRRWSLAGPCCRFR